MNKKSVTDKFTNLERKNILKGIIESSHLLWVKPITTLMYIVYMYSTVYMCTCSTLYMCTCLLYACSTIRVQMFLVVKLILSLCRKHF